MTFTLISKSLALILTLNLHGRAMASIAHPLPVYDASPAQLEAIQKSVFSTIPEKKVETWPETFNVVMRGQGVEIPRKNDVELEWNERIRGKPIVEIEREIAESRGWLGPQPQVPELLDESYVENPEWVQFKDAMYPINVPHGVSHKILWLRGPMTTPKTFAAKVGETLPDVNLLDKNLDDRIEFIHAHDAFGTNVEPTKYDPQLKVGADLRPAPKGPGGYEGEVSMEDGIKAMTWSGRHITRLIEAKYPGQEFVWFRVNRSLRSFHCPNEIHVLILNEMK